MRDRTGPKILKDMADQDSVLQSTVLSTQVVSSPQKAQLARRLAAQHASLNQYAQFKNPAWCERQSQTSLRIHRDHISRINIYTSSRPFTA